MDEELTHLDKLLEILTTEYQIADDVARPLMHAESLSQDCINRGLNSGCK